TYRDLGTESELTKFLSGLVTGEIDKQEYAKSLSPADVLGTPPVRLEGEMWDYQDEIKLRLRIIEPKTGRTLKASNLRIRREQLPGDVKIRPPEGESLDIIQKAVSLSKRHFPDGGDFHLGVWPDKGMDAVYMDGDKLVVYIISEKNAYLHVDYYQVDGQVVHLLPIPDQINFVEGGKPLSIDDYGYDFFVEHPFGEELLMVIATRKRLEIPIEDMKEDAAPYLVRLAKSLRNQKAKGEMAASQIIILTKAIEPENN
ncbi:MAG: DUF4384 domain-containing protein, partial [Deltaproteobacteria bacterium]|nr:DUF4384 domain-containing protein [Deltaproteobacteria bacterium]